MVSKAGQVLEDELALRQAQSWAALAQEYPLIGQAILRHKNTRAEPMSFRVNPSLVEMYADFPHIEGADICKATQTGLSELIIQLHLEASGWRNRIAALVMPTYALRDRFVQRRINPLLQRVPEYRERSGGFSKKGKGAENLKTRQFGDGALLFLGSNSPGDFVEFSCDLLTIDERDKCEEGNLALARDRLRNSPYPQMFMVGNPTVPQVGISEAYERGDRRLFHWRCPHCGERQPIDWFKHVVRKRDDGKWEPRDRERFHRLLENPRGPDLRPVCQKCDKPFDRNPQGAAWVAASPGKRRSYRMTRLDVITDRLWKLFVEEFIPAQGKRVRMAAFYASVLGQPYQDAAAKLTIDMLDRCATGAENDWTGGKDYEDEIVVMGVDVGSVLNVTVDVIHLDDEDKTYRRAAHVLAVTSFEALQDIVKRYRVGTVVIDARPETRKAQEFRDWGLMTGITHVWLAQFHPTDRLSDEDYGLRIDWVTQTLTVDRTQIMDACFDEIREGRRVFPKDIFSTHEWAKQMTAPVRMLDKKGRRFIWSEGSAPDHYRLSDVYARMAADRAGITGGFIG